MGEPSTQIENINWRAVWAEFVAMVLFVFIGCGSAVVITPGTAGDHLLVALAFGFAITALVYTFAHVSGAQINCAVTWALVLNETISAAQGIANFIAQLVGSCVGALFIQAATTPHWKRAEAINYGANALGALQADSVTADVTHITKGNAFAVEFLMTFLLITVVLQTAVNADSKAGAHAAIAIGFAVFLAHAVSIPLTGCSINPTRSFGPAVVSDYWDDHWLWWVGPLSGSTVAWLVNKKLLGPGDPEADAQKQRERAALAALDAEDAMVAL